MKNLKGWSRIASLGYEALPKTMKTYLDAIKEKLQTEIAIISIGPNRNDTIDLGTLLWEEYSE
ncbi:MAG: adenylosuccinate synthetase [Promethearchaeota archaeon]